MKNMKYEELKNIKCGDQIIFDDPLKGQDVPYVLMSPSEDGSYYFVTGYGASMVIKDQKTIDAFNIKLIDNTHPVWDQKLSDHGATLGKMMNLFIDGNIDKIEQFMKDLP